MRRNYRNQGRQSGSTNPYRAGWGSLLYFAAFCCAGRSPFVQGPLTIALPVVYSTGWAAVLAVVAAVVADPGSFSRPFYLFGPFGPFACCSGFAAVAAVFAVS